MTGRTRLTVSAGVASLLGAVVLRPLFTSLDYLLPILGAIVVVSVVAEVCRRLVLPAVAGLAASLLVLALYLIAAFAHRHALFGVFPDAEGRAYLRQLVHSGTNDIAKLAPPVDPHSGLLLLTTSGVGVIAVLVDFIAVGLRRAAAAGLPLFGLFVVPAAVAPHGIGALPFIIASSGYLALLVADGRERLGRWGRPLGAGRRDADGPALRAEVAETSPLARVGRRIAAASLGAAVIVPGLAPGVADKPFGAGGNGNGDGSGSSSVVAINPITQLHGQLTARDNRTLLTYTSNATQTFYLRMTTLDHFNGDEWSQSELRASPDHRVSNGLPGPLGLDATVPTRSVNVQVSAAKSFKVPWLPLPYPATSVDIKGDWRYEDQTRTVFSSRTNTRGVKYRASALLPLPSAAGLRAATSSGVDALYTQLPVGNGAIPQDIVNLTQAVTAKGATAYDKAVLLQDYFQRNFHYSTDVPSGNGTNALREFLLHTRTGYCEQFASAMAAMARILEIPARVDIGFTPGTPTNGAFKVTAHDAHAWPELWFDGYGWLPFEPTPRGDGQVSQPAYSVKASSRPDPTQPTTAPTGGATPRPTASSGPKLPRDEGGSTLGKTGAGASHTSLIVLLALGFLLLLLLAAVPGVSRVVVRRRRWALAETPASAAHAAWSELQATVQDLGGRWDPAETPRTTARRLVRELEPSPETAEALRQLARAEERARYARWTEDTAAEGLEDLQAASSLSAHALRARATRGARWRALVLPRSVIAAGFHRATGLVADVLDGIDAVLAAAGNLLRRGLRPLAQLGSRG